MTRVSGGTTLWADKFDDSFRGIFAVQDSISEKMVNLLNVKVEPEFENLHSDPRFAERLKRIGFPE
jgi:hypothetical protein